MKEAKALDDLLRLAEREGIIVEEWDFAPPVRGMYWHDPPHRPVIGLLKSLPTVDKRCVLAEELGHHFTGRGTGAPRCHFSHYRRICVSQDEHRALRWAAMCLMPEAALVFAVRRGVREIWQLAEWFGVTEEMVRFRLGLADMRKCA